MGAKLGVMECCSSKEDMSSVGFDMVRPESYASCSDMPPIGPCSPEDDFREHGNLDWTVSQLEVVRAGALQLDPALLEAIARDDGPAVLQHVADGADLRDMSEAIRYAAHEGLASVIRELAAIGLEVNAVCPRTGFSALQVATLGSHVMICELLLDAMADVHQRVGNERATTALSLARSVGNPEVVEVIEQHIHRMHMSERDETDAASQTRLHVLPRVSLGLSQAVLEHSNNEAEAGRATRTEVGTPMSPLKEGSESSPEWDENGGGLMQVGGGLGDTAAGSQPAFRRPEGEAAERASGAASAAEGKREAAAHGLDGGGDITHKAVPL